MGRQALRCALAAALLPGGAGDLSLAKLRRSNLGGFGPDAGGPREIRYANASESERGTPLDLVIVATGEYVPHNAHRNVNSGRGGQVGSVNHRCGTRSGLSFRFVDSNTSALANVSELLLAVFLVDPREQVQAHGFREYFLSEGTRLHHRRIGGRGLAASLTRGGRERPPDGFWDPANLSAVEQDFSVLFLIGNDSEFELNFAVTGPREDAGVDLAFAGVPLASFCEQAAARPAQASPAASAGSCLTEPAGWTSATGATCADYASGRFCTPSGGYGSRWPPGWGTFEDWASGGASARDACCECGGGRQEVGAGVGGRASPPNRSAAPQVCCRHWSRTRAWPAGSRRLCGRAARGGAAASSTRPRVVGAKSTTSAPASTASLASSTSTSQRAAAASRSSAANGSTSASASVARPSASTTSAPSRAGNASARHARTSSTATSSSARSATTLQKTTEVSTTKSSAAASPTLVAAVAKATTTSAYSPFSNNCMTWQRMWTETGRTWTEEMQNWCCEHEGFGCPTSTSTTATATHTASSSTTPVHATRTSTAPANASRRPWLRLPACASDCEQSGISAPCGEWLMWAGQHHKSKHRRANACVEARDAVISLCPACAECAAAAQADVCPGAADATAARSANSTANATAANATSGGGGACQRWRGGLQEWCCGHRGIGCQSAEDIIDGCERGLHGRVADLHPARRRFCCTHLPDAPACLREATDVTMPISLEQCRALGNLAEQQAPFQDWCCLHESLKCSDASALELSDAPPPEPGSTSAAQPTTTHRSKSTTSSSAKPKRPTPAPFHCEAGLQDWANRWSLGKLKYCCSSGSVDVAARLRSERACMETVQEFGAAGALAQGDAPRPRRTALAAGAVTSCLAVAVLALRVASPGLWRQPEAPSVHLYVPVPDTELAQ